MNTIKECFEMILHGNEQESHLATRNVRKLLYSSRIGRDIFDDIKNIINSAPVKYVQISEEWRQENFVTAISVIYYGTVAKYSNRVKDKKTNAPLIKFLLISLSLIQFSFSFLCLSPFFLSSEHIPPLVYVA